MRLIIVRHGATEWSETGRHTGLTDIGLTELGRRQASHARRNLERIAPHELEGARIYSSPLTRARETASLVTGRDADIRIADDLRELDYGDYEGMTLPEIQRRSPGWSLWRDGCPNGENVFDIAARVDRFLRRLDSTPEPTLAFAHGHVLRILGARALGLEPQQGSIFSLGTASISIFDDVRGERVVQLWNLEANEGHHA